MRNKKNELNRRLFLFFIGKIVLFSILLTRLFYLQIKEGLYFNKLSDNNRINKIPVLPKRGIIYDNHNQVLAENLFLWEALFIKSQISNNIELFINNISSIIILSDDDKNRILDDYKNQPSYFPILIKKNLSQSEIAAIETFSYNLQGVFIRPFYIRYYPYADIFAHVIGYTGLNEEPSTVNNKKISQWPTGILSLEKSFDSFLRGNIGYNNYEINAYGNIIRHLTEQESKSGDNISLTIDKLLQERVYQLLSEYNSASAIVSEIKTGNILAMVSYPSFDPNLFVNGISNELWSGLVNNERSPLYNKTIMGLYPPASTIKPIIALKALEKGLITKDTTHECKGHLDIGTDRFHCWVKEGHGKVNLMDAISSSCDVYFYKLAHMLKIHDIDSVAKDFGFSKQHLPILPTEEKGQTLLGDMKKPSFSDNIIGIIGQGKWLVTPLQLNKMIALLANGGKEFNFKLLKSIESQNKTIYPKKEQINNHLNYKTEHFNFIRESLFQGLNAEGASGILAKIWHDDWQIAGKTGTAQVRRITLEEREHGIIEHTNLPWNKRNHALCVAYVPKHDPAYAISLIIEHGGSSSTTAAPLIGQIGVFLKDRHPYYVEENNRIKNIMKQSTLNK